MKEVRKTVGSLWWADMLNRFFAVALYLPQELFETLSFKISWPSRMEPQQHVQIVLVSRMYCQNLQMWFTCCSVGERMCHLVNLTVNRHFAFAFFSFLSFVKRLPPTSCYISSCSRSQVPLASLMWYRSRVNFSFWLHSSVHNVTFLSCMWFFFPLFNILFVLNSCFHSAI